MSRSFTSPHGPHGGEHPGHIPCIRPVHTATDEFENEDFTLKTHQMFSVHAKREEYKRRNIIGHFGLVFEENSVREITLIIVTLLFWKNPVFKLFFVHTKAKR